VPARATKNEFPQTCVAVTAHDQKIGLHVPAAVEEDLADTRMGRDLLGRLALHTVACHLERYTTTLLRSANAQLQGTPDEGRSRGATRRSQKRLLI
jgi:hypothetical protein